jgi:hypothetical protein
LNWGAICCPINFYNKSGPELAGKKDRGPLTAGLENFMPMRRLHDGKYDNQQRLGLGDKGDNSGRLVAAVNGMVAAVAAA